MSTRLIPVALKSELAAELLTDIELSRLGTEALLLKASRLARLVGAEMMQKILRCELGGYNSESWQEVADITGRWTDKSKNLGWWGPLAEIDARVEALRAELQQCRVPDVHLSLSSANPNELVTGWGGSSSAALAAPVNNVLKRVSEIRESLGQLGGIRPRVLRLVYDFVTTTYYELSFSSTAGTVFERFQSEVDMRLSPNGLKLSGFCWISDRERLRHGE